jgi:hypothetical protein
MVYLSALPFVAYARHELGRQQWDTFVDATDEAWLWHRYDWQDALATWRGRTDLSFAVLDNRTSEVLALLPIHLVSGKLYRLIPWNTLHSMGGPAFKNNVGDKQRFQVIEFVQQFILGLGRKHSVFEVDLMLTALAPAFRGADCPRVNPLLDFAGCQNTLTQTYVLDLRQSDEVLRAQYSKGARSELKKFEMEGVEIRDAHGTDDLALYYQLHTETYGRTGVPPHPMEYFRHIFEIFIPAGLCRVVFLVREGKVIAAQNTALYKRGGLYWTGASRSDKSGGENRILMQNQLDHARQVGVEWYEVGEAFPNVASGKAKGLNDFKRSFGGELYPVYRGRLVTNRNLHALAEGFRALRRTG